MKKMILLLFYSSLLLVNSAFAGEPKSAVTPKSFESMKQLIGVWEGKGKMHGEEQTVKSVYSLTSGGSAIQHVFMPGTPGEMTTMYHKDGDSMAMTHYCALGNQPYMKLKKATDTTFAFELAGKRGIKSKKEPHMHAVTVTLVGNHKLKEEWVFYKDGKEESATLFSFNRIE